MLRPLRSVKLGSRLRDGRLGFDGSSTEVAFWVQWPDQWEADFPRPSWGPGPLGTCRGCYGMIIREQRRPNSPRLLRPVEGAPPPTFSRRPGGMVPEKPGKSHQPSPKSGLSPLPSSSFSPGAQLEGILSDSEVRAVALHPA